MPCFKRSKAASLVQLQFGHAAGATEDKLYTYGDNNTLCRSGRKRRKSETPQILCTRVIVCLARQCSVCAPPAGQPGRANTNISTRWRFHKIIHNPPRINPFKGDPKSSNDSTCHWNFFFSIFFSINFHHFLKNIMS